MLHVFNRLVAPTMVFCMDLIVVSSCKDSVYSSDVFIILFGPSRVFCTYVLIYWVVV